MDKGYFIYILKHSHPKRAIFTGDGSFAIDIAIEELKQVTGKLNNLDDSLLTADPEAYKEQKSKLNLSTDRPNENGLSKQKMETKAKAYFEIRSMDR